MFAWIRNNADLIAVFVLAMVFTAGVPRYEVRFMPVSFEVR